MPSIPRERLDKLLVDLGLCENRSQAQALVLAGKVRVNGERVDKPGTQLRPDKSELSLESELPYVSRGGFKLEKALDAFQINPANEVCLDIGAATGGFTDCLLQRGARKVYAIDVGYGQLDWRLRQDDRVVCMEQTNIRHLVPEAISERASLAVTDVSFISIKKVLPVLPPFMDGPPEPRIIALLKPQFEYKDYLSDKNFKGVVRGREDHVLIIRKVLEELDALMPGWTFRGVTHSPVTGPKGNIEFPILYARGAEALSGSRDSLIEAVVTESYEVLKPSASVP